MSSIKKNFIDNYNSLIIFILFKMKKYSETEKLFQYKFSVNFKFVINVNLVFLVDKNNILEFKTFFLFLCCLELFVKYFFCDYLYSFYILFVYWIIGILCCNSCKIK